MVGPPTRVAFEMLESCEGKLSRTILKGGGKNRKAPVLPAVPPC